MTVNLLGLLHFLFVGGAPYEVPVPKSAAHLAVLAAPAPSSSYPKI